MSYLSRLQNNNSNLQACINKANALPDAGGSSEGANIENCTVTISGNFIGVSAVYSYINEDDGSIVAVNESDLGNYENPTFKVIKNSMITFISENWAHDFYSTGFSNADVFGDYVQGAVILFRVINDPVSFEFITL